MKFDSLVPDMYRVLTPSEEGGVSDEVLRNFKERLGNHVKDTIEHREDRIREPGVLYASEVGEHCIRKLYYKVTNTDAEGLLGHTHFKFLYGDIIEETALLLAEASGHKVEFTQEKVSAKFGNWEVRGRMDAVIDGVMVDVKSMSTYGMDKLPRVLDDYDDPFGYVDQVSFYRNFGNTGAKEVAILGVDKTLGHIKTSVGRGLDAEVQAARIVSITNVLDKGLPQKAYAEIPEGTSGNMKLPFQCGYCPFKQECWADSNDGKGLRSFIYSKGPVYLTHVEKEPKVPEVMYG